MTATSPPLASVPSTAPPSRPPDSTPSDSTPPDSTVPATTTSTIAPDPLGDADAWAAFDYHLATRLLGAGDFAASVAVALDGTTVHTAAFGYRVPAGDPFAVPPTTDPSASAPSTTERRRSRRDGVVPTDRFRIASISKVITATVVLQLVEAGVLELDHPVGARLGRVVGAEVTDPAIKAITVRQLLSHTSGFPDYQATFFGGGARSCPEAARRGLTGGLVGPPGTVYEYSNLNFCLLGQLIGEVAGLPYQRAVRTLLLRPLGIEGMRLVGTFDPDDEEVVHPSLPRRNYMEVLEGAGSWVASAEDVVTIVDALDPDKPGWHPLSRRMTTEMLRPTVGVTYPDVANRWYGLGAIVFADGSWGHTGTVENTHAMVLDRPDGVTWSLLVSGEYPSDTTQLRNLVDEAIAAAQLSPLS